MQQQPKVSPNLSFQLGFTKQTGRDIQESEVRHSVSGELVAAEAPGASRISGMAGGARAREGPNSQGSVDVHTFADEMDHTFSRPSPGGAGVPSGLDLQQLKFRRFGVKLRSEAAAQRSQTHPDVEAQQVADHGRDGGQDDHSGEVVDQRVHSQAQQPEGGVQLLGQGQRRVSIMLTRLRSEHRLFCSTVN